MRRYFILCLCFLCLSFTGVSSKKRISDSNYRYEFYTTDKTTSIKENREYYWFKGGTIHKSEYGVGGELLHDDFLKFYHTNQLAEAGEYKYGLKVGYWKTWYENGTMQSKTHWRKGQKNGSYYLYDKTGFLLEKGEYKKNMKHGEWIDYINKDTLIYKRGTIKPKEVKKEKSDKKKKNFFNRLFSKKDKNDTIPKIKQKKEDRPERKSFFKRLFSKKKDKEPKKKKAERKAENKQLKNNDKG